MLLRIGVDTGGTFTDLALIDPQTGAFRLHKLSSTPDDPSLAIAQGIAELLAADGADPSSVAYLGHGTTVATNAVIEGHIGKTALLTTAGFRDVIELARQRRPDLYNLDIDKPHPIAARDLRRELDERTAYDGQRLRPVDPAQVRAILADLASAGVEAVAIVLLHSYANPAHERQVKALVEQHLPGVPVCSSSDVLPEFREYERTATTLLNAALMPVMSRYLGALERRVRELGLPHLPHIMQSSGGIMGPAAAGEKPVNTLFSGPSAGVIGAAHVGRLAGFADLITFDMGGTSTDVCLVEQGQPAFTHQRAIAGLPLKAPTLDVHSVGAGGGSIGWIDHGGLLKVGPRSAGARPGPACYGLGGTEPTVTDANVVLRRLNPAYLLDGRMRIDSERSAAAIAERVAQSLGRSLTDAAQGIVRIVNVNMQRAIRVISVERGRDPRQFTLVAFGGAGPLHAAELARDMGIPRVLVPESPGVLCALGLLVADIRADFGRTAPMGGDHADPARLTAIFADLEAQARAWLEREQVPADQGLLARSVDMRYLGQDYELPVAAMAGALAAADVGTLVERFHREHERVYGYCAPDAPTQMVSFRVVASAAVPKPSFEQAAAGGGDLAVARVGEREVWFGDAGGFVACPIYRRASLGPGIELRGPAVLEQMDATTVVLPGQRAYVDSYRNVILEM
ncbi:MAG: hydantoinase/oxoprolinase family protein [Chloroflexi bacterium]|nr:hydantoinase/oxoprolinase family protein [Chloroflexota bacterium]